MCRFRCSLQRSAGSSTYAMLTSTSLQQQTLFLPSAVAVQKSIPKRLEMQKLACSNDNFILEHAAITISLPSAPYISLSFLVRLPCLPYSLLFRPSYIICYIMARVVRRPRTRGSNLDSGSRTPSAWTSRVVLVLLLPPYNFPQPRNRRDKRRY